MAFPTERGSIVVFLVAVAGKTRIAGGNLPYMRSVTGAAGSLRVGRFLMQSFALRVAGATTYQRGFFAPFQMACIAVPGHHGRRLRNLVTLRAAQN